MTPGLGTLRETPSQTAGPYVHIGLIPGQAGFDIFERPFGGPLAGPDTAGERIRIEGRVLDGLGAPCRDVLVEIWQANAAGRYAHPADRQEGKPLDPAFRGWGRTGTDFTTGVYSFETVKPVKPAFGEEPRPVAPSSRISPPAPVAAPGNGAIAVGWLCVSTFISTCASIASLR